MQKELVYRKKGKKLHKHYKLYYAWEFSQAILFDALRDANKQTEKGKHRNNQDILHYTKLWQIRGGKHPLAYYDIACCFDCETTKFSDTFANIWCWQFSIEDTVIIGNTREEFEQFMIQLSQMVGVTEHKRLLVFDANLNYEFSFFKDVMINNLNDYFFRDTHTPIYIICFGGVEFREMLSFGGSLKKIADDYTTLAKLKGDLDYTKIRYTLEDIENPRELDYITSDVLIGSEFANYFMKQHFAKRNNPITATQCVRIEMKNYIKNSGKSVKEVQNQICNMYPDFGLYQDIMNNTLRGGYTHANMLYVGGVYKTRSRDITSAHPSQMVKHRFTMQLKRVYNIENIQFKDLLKYWDNGTPTIGFYGRFRFTNIRCKTSITIESSNKCIELENATLDNGRVYMADKLTTCLNHIDLRIYDMFMEWDSCEILYLYQGKTAYLPDYYINTMLDNYVNKAVLKSQHLNYSYEKSVVNSCYGCAITRMVVQEVEIDKGKPVKIDKLPKEVFEEEKTKQLLLPQWGVEISALTRLQELTMIHDLITIQNDEMKKKGLHNEFVYADTDSIKYIDNGNAEEIFKRYNEKSHERMMYINDLIYHRDIKLIEDLGEYDLEHYVCYVKTLGSKRYCLAYKDGLQWKHETTTAGLPKQSYYDLFKGKCISTKGAVYDDKLNQAFFDLYENELEVQDCKLRTYYPEDPRDNFIVLINTSFSMTMSRDWLKLLRDMSVI